MENKASGLGIAAFVISLIALVVFCLGVLAATLVALDDPLAPDEAYAFAGVIMFMGCFLSLISGGLGWGACCKQGSEKTLPIIGLSFSGLILLLTITSTIIGSIS
ncbi:MAG: hypothetical protein ACJ0BK_03760 [Coraliomargaritaceae bacterium]|jgi:hypothetical protein|tara:strand:+ start:131 stop:445 length:315 start_codon:yes stop_codon:yes gene_type:complete